MGTLSSDELKALLTKLDELCRQAQALQEQIRTEMLARARENTLALSAAPPIRERRAHQRRKR